MKKSIFLLSLFITTNLCSQEKRTLLLGTIKIDTLFIVDANVINKATNIGTNSNKFGEFEIPVKIGDTLSFSHLNYTFKEITIKQKHLDTKNIKISANEKTYVLDEISLNNKSIFYVDKDIMPHNLPMVNAKTLNLPYADSKKGKDNSVTKITFTSFSVDLASLINRVNGNYKREKKAKELIVEDENLNKIRKLFTDDFFVTDLKIKKEYINQFLNFCKNNGVIRIFKTADRIKLTGFLLSESKKFPNQIENEDIFLTKQ